jgi:hypothetical protein
MKHFLISKQSLKKTIQRIRGPYSRHEILWYPHCGGDFNFLRSILTKNNLLSPRIFILNDSYNWNVDFENQPFTILDSEIFQFTEQINDDRERVEYYFIETHGGQKDHVIRILNLDSSHLLGYFLHNQIQIDHIFTSRMAGGLTIDIEGERSDLISEPVRRHLNYKYLITDLHCLSSNHGDEINLNDFDLTVLEKVYYTSGGNIESVFQLCKNNLHIPSYE